MKKTFALLISLLLLSLSNLTSSTNGTGMISSPGDSIKILATPNLFSTAVKWADGYNRLFPDMKIQVISVSDEKTMDKMLGDGKVAFVSNDHFSGFDNQSLWKIVVGRDVIVPIINSKNPLLEKICKQGVTPEALSQFYKKDKPAGWGAILKSNEKTPANYYWINDESLKTGIADFLKTGNITAQGTEVRNGVELVSAIRNDPNALGFCKMTDIPDTIQLGLAGNIRLLPIDRNGNGIIDYNEKIYGGLNDFTRGLWIGKYPKALFSNIYSISHRPPVNPSETAFLKWVVTDGQQFLHGEGFSELAVNERQITIEKIDDSMISVVPTPATGSLARTVLLILIALIVTWLIADFLIRSLKHRKESSLNKEQASIPVLDEGSIVIPNGLYFDKTHTWAFMDQNGVVKVGIDDFLQHVTGPISRIEMKDPGKEIKKGDQILTIIQNGKHLDLYSPVSGTITEQNKTLDKNASVINSSPYSDGWIYKIEPTNWHRENQLLFMAEKQKQYLITEFTRLKDFLVTALREDKVLHAMAILQDGGELRDGVLTDKAPEIWEEFQTKFIDTSRQLWFYEIL